MRPEKSKLLKISLCVLSCVFFGCGDNKPNGGGAGKELTSESINKVLTEQSGKDIQKENPLMKVFEDALKRNTVKKHYDKIEGLMNDPNVKIALEKGDFENARVKELLGLVDNFVDAVNTELNTILNNNDILDTVFEVSEEEITEWKNIGVKDKNVAKAISDLNTIHLMLQEFKNNPLQFLVKNGKGLFHNGTIKAVYLAWRNLVNIVEKKYTHCKTCLNSIKDEKLKNAVLDSLQDRLRGLEKFIDNKDNTKRDILHTVYTQIGDELLDNEGKNFLGMIYCYENKNENTEVAENPDFKVTSAWSKWVFNHYYVGVRSSQDEFSTVASAHHGKNLEKLKTNFTILWGKHFWKNYEEILKKFVTFANEKTFKNGDVDNFCKFLYDVKNDNETKKIYLNPWLMLCAQNKEKEIFDLIEFDSNDIKIKGDKQIKDIVKQCEDDKDNAKLEVYAGIFGICNFVVAMNHFNNNATKINDTTAYKLSDKLKKILLKKRLAQWDKIKKDILTDKKDKKNEEEK